MKIKTIFLITFITSIILSYFIFSNIINELINQHQIWLSEVNLWISKLNLLL